ncbi:MAG: hypothetical protein K1X53_01900 [Candidatus Sumerlaeaceae bacterium]|nr:hypothetical protein [Candidatus Sumerlaeaceae bacterium]
MIRISAVQILLTAAMLLGILRPVSALSADDNSSIPECCRLKVAKPAKLIAIIFRSDADEASRNLAPIIDAVRKELEHDPVLFLTMDFSTTETLKQAEYLANAMDCDDLWNKFGKQSGFVVVADAITKRPLAKLTRFYDAPKMLAELRQLIAAPRDLGP